MNKQPIIKTIDLEKYLTEVNSLYRDKEKLTQELTKINLILNNLPNLLDKYTIYL